MSTPVDETVAATAEGGSRSSLLLPSASRVLRISSGDVIYLDCQKNHAAGIGGSATDGCGEFMAGGEDGTLEALICCACNCHRNFHRKVQIQLPANSQFYPSVGVGATMRKCGEGVKKRFRTKFSAEQKEKMLKFAEKGEWKIQKMEDAQVKCFCQEIGIKKKVLKVWMHNNKYLYAKKPTPNASNDDHN